jgi:hypothetical protein
MEFDMKTEKKLKIRIKATFFVASSLRFLPVFFLLDSLVTCV